MNGAQSLSNTPLFLLSNYFALSSAPSPAIVIVPITHIFTSLKLHKLDFIEIEIQILI